MGILFDASYWADILNRTYNATFSSASAEEQMATVRAIGCEAFTRLIEDPEFAHDLSRAADLAAASDLEAYADTAEFNDFLNVFLSIEGKLFSGAGAEEKPRTAALMELGAIAQARVRGDPFDRFDDKVRFCRDLFCSEEPEDSREPQRSPWQIARRAITGVATIAVDCGTAAAAAVTLGPAGAAAGGTVAGISAGYGAQLVSDALRKRW